MARELTRLLRIAAWVAGASLYLLTVGWVFAVVQFAAARLPALTAADQLTLGQLLSRGLTSALLIVGVVAAGVALAYFSSAPRWDVNGPEWHDIVDRGVAKARADPNRKQERELRKRRHWRRVAARNEQIKRHLAKGRLAFLARVPAAVQARAQRRGGRSGPGKPTARVPSRREDWPVRVLAGFNIMVLSLLISVGIARAIDVLFPVRPWAVLAGWAGLLVGVGVFLLLRWVLTLASPLLLPARGHWLVWGVVAIATLFASVPVGVLVLSGVLVSTYGRRLTKLSRRPSTSPLGRHPLLAALLAITTLLGVGYSATPPVALPNAVVTTVTSEVRGGYISGLGSGVELATCVSLADATSTADRLVLVPAKDVRHVQVGGGSYFLDSGERPSLARLALHALGLSADPPTLFSAALRANQATCASTGPERLSVGVSDPGLGAGVIAGPAVKTPHANEGETPIQADHKTPAGVASLALKYQPTLLVTVADRNWPVSVNAVLAEQGPSRQPVCLIRFAAPSLCRPSSANLRAAATPRDYLQLPVMLGGNRSPAGQFQAFLRAQYQSSGPLHQWLANPGELDPWYSAQVYFYDAGPIASSRWPKQAADPNVPSGLIGLEYWFYYPFNYYPVVVDSGLMDLAPIAGDRANIDLHQGDWEHVDVLLNPAGDKPVWLYMARHSYEGAFVPWTSPRLRFDGTHPVIQAAFGGHPSYLPGCGPAPRPVTFNASSDWLSCGSGRFAFRAATTPLVNIQNTDWACWPGYFGEATGLEVSNSKQPETVIDTATHALYVVGPRGPLVQGENSGICAGGAPRSAYRPLSAKSAGH